MGETDVVLRSSSGATAAGTAGGELLARPARDLLGVTERAAEILGDLGIRTIFDLGASNLFASARAIVEVSRMAATGSRLGLVPGDLLLDGVELAIEDLAMLPLDKLRALPSASATELAIALDVETILDFANWPPYGQARRLIAETMGGTADPDETQAEELRPRFGQFATERVYYSTLAMLQTLGSSPQLQDLKGPISLDPAVQNPVGLNRPAIGALLTYEQSWFAQGVTLGHLIHSLSLAPGEATRVAVIDWSRKTSAYSAETIGESEQLDSATNHARALSEVQEAVASDFQKGGSQASSSSTSTSHAEQTAGSSGLLTSLFSSGSGSIADQSATTTGTAESSSWSLGNRSVMSSLEQNVNDRTEQHSSSVRNRRATAVREVSQTEHESVSTRIVANYNHMHALNLQYYEVVQIYRVEARLNRADRCLFVPMQQLDFAGPNAFAIVERFRGAILAAALNDRVRSLAADDTTAVEIAPASRVVFPGVRPDLLTGALHTTILTAAPVVPVSVAGIGGGAPATPATPVSAPAAPATPVSAPVAAALPGVLLWDTAAVARASRLVERALVRPNSDSLFVPDDTELIGVSIDQVSVATVRVDHVGANAADDQTFTVPAESGRVDFSRGIRFVELDAIHLAKRDEPAANGTLTLHCAYLGRRFTLPAIPIQLGASVALQKAVTFTSDQADRRRELLQHLQNNRGYYSAAIFRSLDSATLTFLLGGFQLDGRALIDQVEPRPVTIAGNYVVLRAPVEDDERSGVSDGSGAALTWGRLLETRGLDRGGTADRRLIPIPTGGVFAEAVLGRSNAAEKLDITRFWNWQDSPIPFAPTEIASVQTGSRATLEDLKPGQLGQPVLNVVSPTALPEPTSMSAILNALSALNFRDMSGLAGTQGLVSAAELGTLDAATAAGKIASENLKTEAQKAVAMGQIAADIAKAVIAGQVAKGQTKAANGGGSVNGISRDGAVLNQGKKMDDASRARSGGGGGGGGGDAVPSVPAVPGDGSGGGGTDGTPGTGNENSAFRALLADSDSGLADKAVELLTAKTGGDGGVGGAGGAGEPARPPFPAEFPEPQNWPESIELRKRFRDAEAAVSTDPLKTSLDAQGALVPPNKLPIIIVALDAGGKHSSVGTSFDQMHYSGSLLKAAAMYAAYQLRKAVFDFSQGLPASLSQEEVFRRFKNDFDAKILAGAPNIPPNLRVPPKYPDVLKVTPDGSHYKVAFLSTGDKSRRDFVHHLKEMTEKSHNPSAGVCVQNLGYSWINGVFRAANLFKEVSRGEFQGIWLAGDYLYAKAQRDKLHAAGTDSDATEEFNMGISGFFEVRIPVLNDGTSKQATTCMDMANLFAQLATGNLIKDAAGSGMTSNADMLAHLTNGVSMSIMGRRMPSTKYNILQSKIGFGTLGRDGNCNSTPTRGCVQSEAMIIERVAAPKPKYVVVFQNVIDPANRNDKDLERIRELIERTI